MLHEAKLVYFRKLIVSSISISNKTGKHCGYLGITQLKCYVGNIYFLITISLFMDSHSDKRLFAVIVILILFSFGYIGWRGLNPSVQTNVVISDFSVNRNETLTLTIETTGRKTICVGHPYEIWREESDETLNLVELNVSWVAEVVEVSRGMSWSQEIFTDLEQGDYVLVKQYTDGGSETHTHSIEFTIQ